MVEHDYERERRKMIQVEESKLFNQTWHHIADGAASGQAAAQPDPQTAPDAHATAPDAHNSTHDRT